MTSLTRRYRFSASHRLHSPELTPEQNSAIFGKCNNPHGHGHNYILEVSVHGEIDARTGRVIHPGKLDRFVEEHIVSKFDHRDMNKDIPELEGRTPTTEIAALEIEKILRGRWPAEWNARLGKIRIYETRNNIFETQNEK